MQRGAFHEDYARGTVIERGSERAFGLVFSAVFLLISLAPILHRPAEAPRVWSLALSITFAVLAWFRPSTLRHLNRLWSYIGLRLHAVTSMIILTVVFFGVVSPLALLRRALGRTPVSWRRDPAVASYWRLRRPPGPPADTMRNQF
jgi:hypothetical protein